MHKKVSNSRKLWGLSRTSRFKTYLFVKPDSAFVTVIHSPMPMQIVAISEVPQHLQGLFIGFVGDHTMTKDHMQIILP
jgi:hypothetical protein